MNGQHIGPPGDSTANRDIPRPAGWGKWLQPEVPAIPSESNDGGDGGFLGFDTLGQLELDQGPGQILFRVADLEIDVPAR